MKSYMLIVLSLMILSLVAAAPATTQATGKIRVLVVTGGHGYKPGAFFTLFDNNPRISFTPATHNKGADVYDRDDLLNYDAIVLYDFQRELTDAQKAKFLSLFDKGVGVVVLHHALLSYQTWPEYERIAGGKYLLDNEKNADGTTTPMSTYKGDVDIAVKVIAKDHPVVAALSDWTLKDEIYRGVRNRSTDATVLLTTEDKPLAWARQEKNSRIVGIIIGHGPAYQDDGFQKLLAQSIAWVAKK